MGKKGVGWAWTLSRLFWANRNARKKHSPLKILDLLFIILYACPIDEDLSDILHYFFLVLAINNDFEL